MVEQEPFDLWLTLEQILHGAVIQQAIPYTLYNGEMENPTKEIAPKLTINVPPGVETDSKLVVPLAEEGNSITVSFIVKVCDHSQFRRLNAVNLEYVYEMTREEATNGGQFEIPTIDGESIFLQINEPITENSCEKIEDKGLPYLGDPKRRGVQFVVFKMQNEIESKRNSDSAFKRKSNELNENEYMIRLSLEEINSGCTKKVSISRNETVSVPVEAGSIEGTRIVLNGLIFQVVQLRHTLFRSTGNDIEFTATITQDQALHGCRLRVPTLSGEKIDLKTQPPVTEGSVYKIQHTGLPVLHEPGKRGNLIVDFQIVPNLPQDAPIVMDLSLTIEQLRQGCTKKFNIQKKVINDDGEQIQISKQLAIEILPGTPFGAKFTFANEGDQYFDRIPADIVFVLKEKQKPLITVPKTGDLLNGKTGFSNERTLFISLEDVLKGSEIKRQIFCKSRSGDGSMVEKPKIVNIQIKPGTVGGTTFSFSGEAVGAEQMTEDIIFIIQDKPHRKFRRLNATDLLYTAYIETTTPPPGGCFFIPTLEKTTIPLLIAEETISLTEKYEIPGKGLPNLEDPNKRGTLYVSFRMMQNIFQGSSLNVTADSNSDAESDADNI